MTPSLILTVVLLVLWILARAVYRLSASNWTWLVIPISFLIAWAFWNSVLTFIDGQFETASTWPRYVLALFAAVICEAILTFYVDHREAKSGLIHWGPVGLRLLLVLAISFILLEPIVTHEEEEFNQRHVAILMDSSASMDLSDPGTVEGPDDANIARRDVARSVLLNTEGESRSLLEQVESDYAVSLYEFANTPREMNLDDWRKENVALEKSQSNDLDSSAGDWNKSTNTAAAIRRVDDQLPLDELSGLIFVTDGCDHSPVDLEKTIDRFAQRNIPIHTVLVGDQTPVRDAEVTAVHTSQQVFLGDSVVIRSAIKVDRLPGQIVQVRLLKDQETIEERTIQVKGNRHRETLVFRDQPDQVGVHQYTVELDPVPGERVKENNRMSARVWVSKDSIRMLMVENRPRWEFRYLKNLFAGRDRSVQLQYVLLRPDRLAAVPDPPIMHASVNRAFDDCEATALPSSEEEWLKFDVILLGDVSPEDLGSDVMRTLEKFVSSRAGTLIVVSGRQHMPHAFKRTPLSDILPVQLEDSRPGDAVSPDAAYYFNVASGADSHVIMQQSTNPLENNEVWQSLPKLFWRHPASKAKAGATVLAYADNDRNTVDSPQDQRDRALILWHRFGAGKVMQLAFDQTWRLRYGIGDQYHHQFWGQVLRWSIQERLAAGTELVRLGTDRVLYRAGDTITVRARLLDENRNPVSSDDTTASIYLNDELVRQTVLNSGPEEDGVLNAKIEGLKVAGKYRIELGGPTIEGLLKREGLAEDSVSIDFALEGADVATEMSDIVADSMVANQLADRTGGMVTRPTDASRILEGLGPKSIFHREQWTVPLWNLWPLMITFLLLVCSEWVWRKSTGLI